MRTQRSGRTSHASQRHARQYPSLVSYSFHTQDPYIEPLGLWVGKRSTSISGTVRIIHSEDRSPSHQRTIPVGAYPPTGRRTTTSGTAWRGRASKRRSSLTSNVPDKPTFSRNSSTTSQGRTTSSPLNPRSTNSTTRSTQTSQMMPT